MNILSKNLLILASAGSGKTYQLSNRVIGLIGSGFDPRMVVALTFTRKAAGEFADEILRKLASAARDEVVAADLRDEIGMAGCEFGEVLERVVRSLPDITLGTLDSFFARIVRGFQYELGVTGGGFELLEGPAHDAAVDEILAAILHDALGRSEGENFLFSFRRATAGREEQRIRDLLRQFVERWHGLWRDGVPVGHWGSEVLMPEGTTSDWEAAKGKLLGPLRDALAEVECPDRRQGDALQKLVDALEAHTAGSGLLGEQSSFFDKVVEEVAAGGRGALQLSHYKPFEVCGEAADLLRQVVRAAARAELGVALERTRAVAEIVRVFDAECERRLRRRGRLGFEDVKRLMGEWVGSEEARLQRESIDFRLDARYDHWLLDEFQDTSRAEWVGIVPLLDEAASGEERTLFVVGDKKQGIYGWRGGEVGLFDEVTHRYQGGLELETMPVSWRSCPEVLALVNRVCGDLETMEGLFGSEVVSKWDWEEHVSAEPLQKPERRGEARVEVVSGGREERLARMVEVMREVGVGVRELTCGVLVRTNKELRETADYLRAEGYDVVEEGRRAPASDNPLGLAVRGMVEWLAQPGDRFARTVVDMSPLAGQLEERFGEAWQAQWEGLLMMAEEEGLAGMVEAVVEPLWSDCSAFAQRRIGDVLAALGIVDATRGGIQDAARVLRDLEVAQAPGVAAVQVMTIHKSKGLGFDVVLLPNLPDEQIPSRTHFRTARGDGWVTEVPAAWARRFVPELVAAEEEWVAQQRYEAFCLLYVALTRAKRGLYVLLAAPPKSRQKGSESWASLTNWIRTSCGNGEDGEVLFHEGTSGWVESVAEAPAGPAAGPEFALGAAVARRERISPSSRKEGPSGPVVGGRGRRFGSEVHALFEQVGWLREGEEPDFPKQANREAIRVVRACLAAPDVAACFRKGEGVELYREQPFEVLVDGSWMSGVVDRLHLRKDDTGKVVECELLDFKTDQVDGMDDLVERYSVQLEEYGRALAALFDLPGAAVRCLVVSTHLKAVSEVRWED